MDIPFGLPVEWSSTSPKPIENVLSSYSIVWRDLVKDVLGAQIAENRRGKDVGKLA